MPKIYNDIQNKLKIAMKEKKSLDLSVLRMLISAIKNKKIELKSQEELSEEQVVQVVKSEIKKRKEAIISFEEGNRPDLAEQEKAEIEVLEKFMPEQMGEAEIEQIVKSVIDSFDSISPQDFGKVMGQAMARVGNAADGSLVSQVVKKYLTKQ